MVTSYASSLAKQLQWHPQCDLCPPSHRLWAAFTEPDVNYFSYRMSIKSNQKLVGDARDSCATIAPVGSSYLLGWLCCIWVQR